MSQALKRVASRIPGWLRHKAHAFAGNTSGSAAILAALMFPVVIGGMGLGAETGYWYFKQRELQHAADLAAHAAGTRKRAGDSGAELREAALEIAEKAGFSSASGTLTINVPPVAGRYQGSTDAVEVVLTFNTPRLLSSIFSSDPVTMGAGAVTLVRGGQQACVLALSPSDSGAVTMAGSTTVNLNGCDLASNSLASNSVEMSGSASLSAGCVYAVGEIVETTRLTLTECAAVKEYAPVTADPYANVPEPQPSDVPCDGRTRLNDETATPTFMYQSSVPAMHFCDGLRVTGTVVFEPGLYIISGGEFWANGNAAVIQGAGVTFFLASTATARLNGTAALNLTAPTTGPYSGLVFFGDRSGTGLEHQVNGTSGSIVQGAVYFPASHVSFSGNSRTSGGSGCTQVIGFTIELTGNSSLRSTCELSGTRTALANRFVRIVE